jgi:hypothetical protein
MLGLTVCLYNWQWLQLWMSHLGSNESLRSLTAVARVELQGSSKNKQGELQGFNMQDPTAEIKVQQSNYTLEQGSS